MTKTMLALTICSAVAIPAFANNNGDAACVPSNSTTGESVYYTPAKKPVAHNRVVRRQYSSAESRRIWLRNHTPSGMILGNMSGAAGNSAMAYLHGTDNPYGSAIYDNDEGPSARPMGWENKDRSTASDTSEDSF